MRGMSRIQRQWEQTQQHHDPKHMIVKGKRTWLLTCAAVSRIWVELYLAAYRVSFKKSHRTGLCVMTLLPDLQWNTLYEKAVDYIKSISTHSNLVRPSQSVCLLNTQYWFSCLISFPVCKMHNVAFWVYHIQYWLYMIYEQLKVFAFSLRKVLAAWICKASTKSQPALSL